MQKAVEAKSALPPRVRATGNIQGYKPIRRVDPVYPPLAAQARIQGIVRLEVTVGKDGQVRDARVIRGHPLLVTAALEAVKQWVYQATVVNGEPVEVASEVEVPFTLGPDVLPR